RANEQAFAERGSKLAEERKRLSLIDSDILKLAATLHRYHDDIHECVTRIQQGYESIRQVPLEGLQEQLDGTRAAIVQVADLIYDVDQKIGLDSLAQGGVAHQEGTWQAESNWEKHWKEYAQQEREVRERVEAMLAAIESLQQTPQSTKSEARRSLERSAREMEQLKRTEVDVGAHGVRPGRPVQATPEESIEPVARRGAVLDDHLVALREHQASLARAGELLASLAEGKGGDVPTLPEVLVQIESALTALVHLAQRTQGSVAALETAAGAVFLQAERIEKMLQERDQASQQLSERLNALQEEEDVERARIAHEWQSRRQAVQERRASLLSWHEDARQGMGQAEAQPVLQRIGIIQDEASAHWPDLVVNQMDYALVQWGQQFAGIEGRAEGETVVERLTRDLE
ncbi:MAG: hypothetical protein ACRDIB_16280, partial [Ardenticatenaceae bacterium]